MNHRPFEDWLLEDQPLSPEQKRELQSHLRVCSSCTAIAESNLALHSTRLAPPAAGFAGRFQLRLMQHRREQRWRQIIGSLVLVAGGLALLYWLAGPVIQEMLRSPAQWITTVVGYFLFVLTFIQALSEVGVILVRILPDFVSPLGWFILTLMVSGLATVWTVSIWRYARIPQGV
jgi:hypothetical protein